MFLPEAICLTVPVERTGRSAIVTPYAHINDFLLNEFQRGIDVPVIGMEFRSLKKGELI